MSKKDTIKKHIEVVNKLKTDYPAIKKMVENTGKSLPSIAEFNKAMEVIKSKAEGKLKKAKRFFFKAKAAKAKLAILKLGN